MGIGAWLSSAQQGEHLSRWVRQVRGRPNAPTTRIVTVAGGKGGVGKSNFCLNFGLALQARGSRVVLVDCDVGLGSLDVLLGMTPYRHLGHVLNGECALDEVEVPGPWGIRLVAAHPEAWAADAERGEAAMWPGLLADLAERADVILLDAGAGLGEVVRSVLGVGREAVIVTTPEPTALTDAYATLKTLRRQNSDAWVGLVVNLVDGAADGNAAFRALASVCRSYLQWSPVYLGAIPRDPALPRAVRGQRPLLIDAPQAPAARAVRALAATFGRRGDIAEGEARG